MISTDDEDDMKCEPQEETLTASFSPSLPLDLLFLPPDFAAEKGDFFSLKIINKKNVVLPDDSDVVYETSSLIIVQSVWRHACYCC